MTFAEKTLSLKAFNQSYDCYSNFSSSDNAAMTFDVTAFILSTFFPLDSFQ